MLELDMIPLEHFVDLYRNSHFSQVYIYAYCVCGRVTFHSSGIDSFQKTDFQVRRLNLVGRLTNTDTGRSRLLQLRFRTGPSVFAPLDILFSSK
jgi:hypothetical protein